ncbi:hypothetical protein D3218_12930 [Aureimonas flava]|uniref:Helix-turn-helix domain-containing protein n=1 Tax=Aureimonas flava TaxID=2320271 RepID=A0A3A1WIX3_9HYPH|nr:hypothetical protein D3218_12930 [Aureimonas flava]
MWMRSLLEADASAVPAGAKCVGCRLALYMHADKESAYPSHAELGRAVGLSGRMVQTHIATLEAQRWLEVKHVRNRGNTYLLRYWWAE